MRHLNLNIDEYINYIQKNPIEVDLFLDKFTINYTYFFRNLNVFENFEKFIKIYIKNHKKNILKIWSAPCATGDEPFTIALILDNLKKNIMNFLTFKYLHLILIQMHLKWQKKGFMENMLSMKCQSTI